MKYYLLLLIAFVFVSCADEETIQVDEINDSQSLSAGLVGAEISYTVNHGVDLNVSKTELLAAFNDHSKATKLGKTAVSYEVFNYGEQHYLRFHNSDGSASNMALTNANHEAASLEGGNSNDGFESRQFVVEGTTCTSTACATCCGCVPVGQYCTSCDSPLGKDCKRSTSSDEIQS